MSACWTFFGISHCRIRQCSPWLCPVGPQRLRKTLRHAGSQVSKVTPGLSRMGQKNLFTSWLSLRSKTQVEWGCSLWLSSNSRSGPHGYGQTHQKLEPWLHCWNLFHQLSSSIFFSISCDYADRRQNPSSEWTSSGKIVTADCAKPLWDGNKVKTSNS